jgi:CubicO group peptidase (beta-lactamase class C family)
MKTNLAFQCLFCFFMLIACQSSPEAIDKQPDNQLLSASPESVGMQSEALAEMLLFAKNEGIRVNSIVIARQGKTVLDAHFYPNKKGYHHDVASVTKSITSIIVGLTIDKGFIKSEDEKVATFFPEYAELFDSEWKQSLSLRDLLTMTSGLCGSFREGENQLGEMRLQSEPIR